MKDGQRNAGSIELSRQDLLLDPTPKGNLFPSDLDTHATRGIQQVEVTTAP